MDEKFMKIALKEAQISFNNDEVPIGAVIVKGTEVIAKAHNTRNKSQNAINHAEILAISKACKKLKSWRLEDCDIYVTLEPCPMCAGAILNARIKNVYFGAYDKTSKTNLLNQIMQDDRLNHKTTPIGGILQTECSNLLTTFFKSKRLNSNITSEE
ncbi:MAG: nucleoside deaminase [Eubacteriales bacterium]|nr:nucleoside deaminase [Eubacteriales bacterium]